MGEPPSLPAVKDKVKVPAPPVVEVKVGALGVVAAPRISKLLVTF